MAPELGEMAKRPNKGFLRVVLGPVSVAGEPVRQTIHPVHVRVIELALRVRITGQYSADQLGVVHGLRSERTESSTYLFDTSSSQKVAEAAASGVATFFVW